MLMEILIIDIMINVSILIILYELVTMRPLL